MKSHLFIFALTLSGYAQEIAPRMVTPSGKSIVVPAGLIKKQLIKLDIKRLQNLKNPLVIPPTSKLKYKWDADKHLVGNNDIINAGGFIFPRNIPIVSPESRGFYREYIRYNVCCIAAASHLEPVGNGYVKIKNTGSLFERRLLKKEMAFANEPTVGIHKYAQGTKKFHPATGFLISKNHLVTAYHVIEGMTEAERKQELRFIFGYRHYPLLLAKNKYQVPEQYIRRYKKLIRVGKNYRSMGDSDWCVIELDDSDYPFSGLNLATRRPILGDEVIMVGHPVGLPLKDHEKATVTKTNKSQTRGLFYECTLDGFKGNSGSPVFSKDSLTVIGIFVASHRTDFYREDHLSTQPGVAPQQFISILPLAENKTNSPPIPAH